MDIETQRLQVQKEGYYVGIFLWDIANKTRDGSETRIQGMMKLPVRLPPVKTK
jgi:hypothetical protein